MKRFLIFLFSCLLLIFNFSNLNLAKGDRIFDYPLFSEKLIKDDYFNRGFNKNVIFLEIDNLHSLFINKTINSKPVTPFINKILKADSPVFENCYMYNDSGKYGHIFSALSGFLPDSRYDAFNYYLDKEFFPLPLVFKEKSYKTNVLIQDYNFDKSETNFYKNLYSSVSTFSNISDLFKYFDNIDRNNLFFTHIHLKHLNDSSNSFNGSAYNKSLYNEASYVHFIDSFLNSFYTYLSNKNLLDNTVVVVLGNNIYNDVFSKKYENFISYFKSLDSKFLPSDFDKIRVPFLIIDKTALQRDALSSKNQKIISSVDIYPTILNFFGFDLDLPFIGHNGGSDLVVLGRPFNVGSHITQNYNFITPHIGSFNGSTISDSNFSNVAKSNYIMTNIMIDMCRDLSFYNRFGDIKKFIKNGKFDSLASDKIIMHAGGDVYSMTYTNSLQALSKNYANGRRFFEIDFSYTSDKKYIALHSWNGFITKFLKLPSIGEKPYDFQTFNSRFESHGLNLLSLDQLMNWFNKNKDAYLITDCKQDNIHFLAEIKKKYPHLQSRIIPQIYYFNQYQEAKSLGYSNIIFTLYMSNYSDEAIINFAKNNKLYAITLEEDKFSKNKLGNKLIKSNIPVFIHTINDLDKANKYIKEGVSKVYSDFL